MSLSGIVIGLVNIIAVVLILLLIGAVIKWICDWLNFGIPAMVQKLYIALVAVIALYMVVALLFGIPVVKVIGTHRGRLMSLALTGA